LLACEEGSRGKTSMGYGVVMKLLMGLEEKRALHGYGELFLFHTTFWRLGQKRDLDNGHC
jgi:hypothetical protein